MLRSLSLLVLVGAAAALVPMGAPLGLARTVDASRLALAPHMALRAPEDLMAEGLVNVAVSNSKLLPLAHVMMDVVGFVKQVRVGLTGLVALQLELAVLNARLAIRQRREAALASAQQAVEGARRAPSDLVVQARATAAEGLEALKAAPANLERAVKVFATQTASTLQSEANSAVSNAKNQLNGGAAGVSALAGTAFAVISGDSSNSV